MIVIELQWPGAEAQRHDRTCSPVHRVVAAGSSLHGKLRQARAVKAQDAGVQEHLSQLHGQQQERGFTEGELVQYPAWLPGLPKPRVLGSRNTSASCRDNNRRGTVLAEDSRLEDRSLAHRGKPAAGTTTTEEGCVVRRQQSCCHGRLRHAEAAEARKRGEGGHQAGCECVQACLWDACQGIWR